MKKTLTINLGGTVFHIDEDAYQKLNNYLYELGHHFPEEERQEILNDIEARIAELFSDRLQHRNVVEMKDVEEVIETLGRPSQFEEEGSGPTKEAPSSVGATTGGRRHRKFYRDGANKKLGGVAAGVAAYMDWDVTLVRVLLVLLFVFSMGWTILAYVLVWILAPEATSVAQQLEMQGVDPTIDNIRNFKPREDVTSRGGSDALGILLKAILAVVIASVAFSLLVSVLGVVVLSGMLLFDLLPGMTLGRMETLLLVSTSLFLLIPAVGLVLLCVRLFKRDTRIPGWSIVVMALLFVASIAAMVVSGIGVAKKYADAPAPHFWEEEYYEQYWQKSPLGEKRHDTLYVVQGDTLALPPSDTVDYKKYL